MTPYEFSELSAALGFIQDGRIDKGREIIKEIINRHKLALEQIANQKNPDAA